MQVMEGRACRHVYYFGCRIQLIYSLIICFICQSYVDVCRTHSFKYSDPYVNEEITWEKPTKHYNNITLCCDKLMTNSMGEANQTLQQHNIMLR